MEGKSRIVIKSSTAAAIKCEIIIMTQWFSYEPLSTSLTCCTHIHSLTCYGPQLWGCFCPSSPIFFMYFCLFELFFNRYTNISYYYNNMMLRLNILCAIEIIEILRTAQEHSSHVQCFLHVFYLNVIYDCIFWFSVSNSNFIGINVPPYHQRYGLLNWALITN